MPFRLIYGTTRGQSALWDCSAFLWINWKQRSAIEAYWKRKDRCCSLQGILLRCTKTLESGRIFLITISLGLKQFRGIGGREKKTGWVYLWHLWEMECLGDILNLIFTGKNIKRPAIIRYKDMRLDPNNLMIADVIYIIENSRRTSAFYRRLGRTLS